MAQLFDTRTIGTLAGASLIVVVTTAVIKDVVDPPPQLLKVISLIVAEVLAFLAASLVRPRTTLVFFLAFFNGLLIYATAAGLNTMNNATGGAKQQQAALFPTVDTVAWWPPAEMAVLQAAARDASSSIAEAAPALSRAASVLKEPTLPLRDRAGELQRQLANLADQRRAILERLDALAKEASKPVHPAEHEAVERRRQKDREDLEREQARLDDVEKNAKERLSDVARVEAALAEAKGATAPTAEPLEQASRRLAGTLEELNAALAAANRVTGLTGANRE